MHTIGPEAHGIASFAILKGLVHKLIAKDVIGRDEVLDICAAVKGAFGVSGLRDDNVVESDAALLASLFISEIEHHS